MTALPSACADVVFADPPYFLAVDGTTCQNGKRVSVDKGAWNRGAAGGGGEHAWHRQWLRAAQRLLKPSGTIWVCGSYESIWSVGWAMQELGFHILNAISWCKPDASPNLACRMFTHSTEMIIWAAPRERAPLPHVFNYAIMREENGGKQMRDFWVLHKRRDPSENKHGTHTTQKPLELVRRCILASTSASGLVIDPFNGSGTTGVAALALGSSYIGVDLDTKHLDITSARIADL